MSRKNGQQLTLPAMLKRKRLADGPKEEALESSQPKRRYLQPINKQDTVKPKSVLRRRPSMDDENRTLSKFREMTCVVTHLQERKCPFPSFPWANRDVLWQSMVGPDVRSRQSRDSSIFESNPEVQPKMRSILLDWLIEVAEVYKLHRETYYLAQDYVDRVLFASQGMPKNELQLLGITCLFVASKVEEIYPPKVSEFAYVTDGACTEQSILDHEVYVLKALEWDLCPLTPAGWVRLYLQFSSRSGEENKLDMPRFPPKALPMVSRLLDLATLDSGCMTFSYSELAAGAFALVYGRERALDASGFQWPELKKCVAWMARFAITLHTEGLIVIAGTEEVEVADQDVRPELVLAATAHVENEHNLQSHVVTLKMLVSAYEPGVGEVAQKCFEENFEEELTSGKSSSSSPESKLKTPSNKVSKHPEDAEGFEKAPVKMSSTKPLAQNLNPKELFQSPEVTKFDR
ncbi:G1/S-specific cyclin-E1 [Neocloeon triangulifer]|uniref:G1/S-specific cyclin-E1 n=1 Tax=Neocloeon triangulifer TaxID=2078957 RepID=UPI00286EB99F|nr:G1/S-specific cyclin-E1 [Neocloeon triangulifer]